ATLSPVSDPVQRPSLLGLNTERKNLLAPPLEPISATERAPTTRPRAPQICPREEADYKSFIFGFIANLNNFLISIFCLFAVCFFCCCVLLVLQVSDALVQAMAEACDEGAWWLGVADEEATRGMRLLGFLLLISAENTTSAFSLSSGVGAWNAVVFEIVMTFGLVYTVYATAIDPKKGNIGIIAPIAIGFIVGANILAGGAFDGASMNPAVSFGPAVVSWTWDNHWVYWLGPFVGAAIAAIVYEVFFIAPDTHEQLPTTEY
ncbi:hypothetical protein V6Z11_D05G101400, partial [Gossypium hirsutum]